MPMQPDGMSPAAHAALASNLANAVVSGDIRIDDVNAGWVKSQLDEMIQLAQEEINKSTQFYMAAQRIDFGRTRAGQAMKAKFVQRSSEEPGGAVWFWKQYHQTLVRFRENVVAMARSWEAADEDSAARNRSIHT
ncbi:hypothetical protein GCM10012275_24580 [Longimycelium tulufanense]|uniref:Uncharacterized protein n=1 Tax=Longimycelium tulufanense TaxID=907463 RepID=A0A8J3FWF5_9PSEU|nr:hypothetical protein [Longimycelium tulufanense]GGM52673.1 hypothetical protein GCM10012275_24580 [Longimycelium tulufanense]